MSSRTHRRVTRRRFLGIAAATGGAAAVPVAAIRLLDRGARSGTPAAGDDPAATAPTAVPSTALPPAPEPSTPAGTDSLLVSIQLDGGNDGLNTVVPFADPEYHRLRGEAAIGDDELSRLDDDFALASMPFLADRWSAGELAIVHGVGVVDGSLSHFDSAAVWERADVDPRVTTGWLGRALDQLVDEDPDPLLGLSVGGSSASMTAPGWTPFTLPADGVIPWSAEFRAANPGLGRAFPELATVTDEDPPLAAAVRRSQDVVLDVGGRIGRSSAPGDGAHGDAVADSALGRQLALVADLIGGDLPTRAFHLRHGGFDTHADQLGAHRRLLVELDEAIAGFLARLGAGADRVVIMTWSEFGRRARFNGSGTDHGTAAPALVTGSRVIGGHHGAAPALDRLDRAGNLVVTTDFRDYLSGVVAGTLGVDPEPVAPGRRPLELVR